MLGVTLLLLIVAYTLIYAAISGKSPVLLVQTAFAKAQQKP